MSGFSRIEKLRAGRALTSNKVIHSTNDLSTLISLLSGLTLREREIILNQFPFCFLPLAKMMLYTFPISSTASCSTGVLAQLEHTGHWQVCIYRELSFPAHVQWTKSALTSYPIYLLNVLLWRKKIFSMNDTCKYMCLHIKPEKKKKKKAWESM